MTVRLHPTFWFIAALAFAPQAMAFYGLNANGKIESLKRHLAVTPQDAAAHVELGVLLRNQAKFEDATIQFGTAAQLNPQSATYALELGKTLLMWRHYATAYDYLNAIEHRFGALPWFRYEFAYALYGQRRYQEALAQARDLIRKWPAMPDAYYLLGNCEWAMNDVQSAIVSYRHAIRIKANDAAYYVALAKVLRASNELDEAVSGLKKATALDPDNVDANFELALCLDERGNLAKAEDLLDAINKVNPKLARVHSILARIYFKQGRRSEALREEDIAKVLRQENLSEVERAVMQKNKQ